MCRRLTLHFRPPATGEGISAYGCTDALATPGRIGGCHTPAVAIGKDAPVTRELKLALIVGFSLVLVVTVLISDHLSRASKDTLEPSLAQTPPLIPKETPEPASSLTPGEPPASLTLHTPPSGSVDPAVGHTTPSGSGTVEISMSRTANLGTGSDDSSDLARAVKALGGEIRDGRVYLPPAAGTALPDNQPSPGTVPGGLNHGANNPGGSGFGNGTTPLGPSGITPPPAPAAEPDRVYVVVAGDSAYKIAKREFGDGELWRTLVAYNKGVIPDSGSLREGMKIKLPPKKDAQASKPAGNDSRTAKATPSGLTPSAATPKADAKFRTYVIKKGDTLGTIASKELGTVRRLQEIIDLNKGILSDPDVAPLGVTIKLPMT